jgi:hypothetical protein
MNKKLLLVLIVFVVLIPVIIVSTLFFLTLTAVNPSQNFSATRNAQRSADIQQIHTTIRQYLAELDSSTLERLGDIPLCGNSSKAIGTGSGNIDLGKTLIPMFMTSVPKDPQTGTDEDTGYTICKVTGYDVQIRAPKAENGKVIQVP